MGLPAPVIPPPIAQCWLCSGDGTIEIGGRSGLHPCDECEGSGKVVRTEPLKPLRECHSCSGGLVGKDICATCGGSGFVIEIECEYCGGLGQIESALTGGLSACDLCGGSGIRPAQELDS